MENVSEEDVKDVFGFSAPTEGQLSSISSWAQRALELTANIEQVEEHLNFLKKELAAIEEVSLPQALLAANMSEFTMTGGGKIQIEDVIQGGLSKDLDKRDATIKYIISEGGEEIIKDNFEVSFPKGRYEDAVFLRKLLSENKVIFDEFEGVHAQTLKAFLREKIESGAIPPFEEMGIRYFK